MEFSEYLQLDRMAHWPRFLRHPVDHLDAIYNNSIVIERDQAQIVFEYSG